MYGIWGPLMTPEDEARARAFIEASKWVEAVSYREFAPHSYTTRRTARARGLDSEFTWFADLIGRAGYARRWGRHTWPSIDLGLDTFWLYREWFEPAERTVINRHPTAELGTGPRRRPPAQLTLFADDDNR